MGEQLQFKISSALKDIIGKDLITDDYIAIFELVKNSFDAYASRVDIHFESMYSIHPKIIIKDNGKGMNLDDLMNKWLFVAYSAKREGTEDENFDYRDKIFINRPFAGAKGIGRFSCDRLGTKLYLETIKKENNAKVEAIITDWEKFEGNLREEFINISVLHETKELSSYGLTHGTVLEITDLREDWDRAKLLRLKSSLAKLINPKKGKGEHNFKIYIHSDEEEDTDKAQSESYNIVNGEVENFIFETLGLKTTKIYTSVSADGNYVTTELRDGGTLIYRIKEINTYKLLSEIDITLYYLNMSAKLTFNHRMGLPTYRYGHIFLYKNGFRVFPYGEPGEDPLKIDSRKHQGHNRYLGNRELIGQVEIFSDSNELKETSSRGDGLIKTKTYFQLDDFIFETLKRLEKYVVDVQKWGLSIEEDNSHDIKLRIGNLIAKLSGSENIIEFDYDKESLELLEQSQSSSADAIVKNLTEIALRTGDSELLEEANKASKRILELKGAKDELEIEKNIIAYEKGMVVAQLAIKERENALLKEASNEDIVELMSIEHHINQATFRIDEYIHNLFLIIPKGTNEREIYINNLDRISLESKKIASLVKFVRKANFDLLSAKVNNDLIQYIDEYIRNVYEKDNIRIINQLLVKNVQINVVDSVTFTREFIPLEINIVLDNLLDNSFKASAKKVEILLYVKNELLIIDYKDNGVGISPHVKNEIFEFGVTTTGGSGIGLYHIKKIINLMRGSISIKNSTHGANFIIEIPKK